MGEDKYAYGNISAFNSRVEIGDIMGLASRDTQTQTLFEYQSHGDEATMRGNAMRAGVTDVVFETMDMDAFCQEASPMSYRTLRAAAYPPIGDQLDALWKGGAAAEEMLTQIQAVKARYPKGA